MATGVKVLIDFTDEYGKHITEYGYILRRLNVDLYEIWGESSQITFWLSRTEFTEIPKEN